MNTQVQTAVEALVSEMNAWQDKYYATMSDHALYSDQSYIDRNRYVVDVKKKYVCITKSGSMYAFIDKETGEIFKPASWRAPAKGVRGNVLSAHGGKEALSFDMCGLVFVRYANGR